jgi:hypothetical protein
MILSDELTTRSPIQHGCKQARLKLLDLDARISQARYLKHRIAANSQ